MIWWKMWGGVIGRGGGEGGWGLDNEAPALDEGGSLIKEAVFIYWHEFMAAFKDGTHSDIHDANFMSFH